MHAPKTEILSKKANREVRIPSHMIMSPAFLKLTRTSMVVLLLFLEKRSWHFEKTGKRKGRPIYHNKGHKFTYSEAAQYGIGKAQFRRAIRQLIELGFIEIAKQGGQFMGTRKCSEYDITDNWMLYGTALFKPRPVRKAPCFSRGFSEYNERRKLAKAEKSREPIPTTGYPPSMTIGASL